MFLITGITGKVGGAAARQLLKQGKQVRALVRQKEKAASWAEQGVDLIEGSWENANAMTAALNGVEGAYLMMPPIMAPSPDFREAKAVIAGYKEALSKVPPPKVVALSSIGSEKTSGLGAVNSTHLLEEALRDASFPIAFIRAGAFYENFLYGLQTGEQGVLPLFYSPTDRKLPMIATADIGSEVANLLTSAWDGKLYVELGSMVSPDEMAVQLGEVLGREVKAQAIPRDTWVAALGQVGVPEDSTWAYEEMIEGVNSGWIDFGAEGARRVEGRTTAKQVFLAEKN